MNSLLATWSIADHPSLKLPEIDNIRHALSGLAIAFETLNNRYADRVFLEAQGASANLALKFPLEKSKNARLEEQATMAKAAQVAEYSLEEAVAKIQEAVSLAYGRISAPEFLPAEVPNPESMGFSGLLYRLSTS